MSYQEKRLSSGGSHIKPILTVLKETADLIKEGMSNEQNCLKSRWGGVNKLLNGGFRFGNNYFLAGASGHGKSFFLNMILQDFFNDDLNKEFVKPFKVLHFGFEMSAADEMLRRMSADCDISYADLMGAERKLTKTQYNFVRDKLRKLKEMPIFFIENPTTRYRMYETIKKFKAKFPDDNLIVSIDHTLLVQSEPGENEIETMAGIGKLFIEIRKEFNTMNILLGQLNDKIESEKRLDPSNPSLHYPTKTDIHGSKQIFHAADVVMVIHQPILLHLEYYGKDNIHTKDLVAVHFLKNRKGTQGLTLLTNDLSKGKFETRNYKPQANGYNFNG